MMSNQDIELIKRARSFALALNIQDTGLQNFLASLVPSSSPPSPSSPPPSPPYSEGISKLSSSAQGRCLGAGEDVSANRVKASGDVSANRVKASGDVSANRVKASGDVLSSSAQGRCLGAGEDVSANRVKASGDVLSSSAQGRCLGAGEDVDTLSPIAQGRCLGARGGDVDTLTLIPPPDTLSPYLDVSTDELLKKASVIAELASNSQILPPKTYSQLLQDQKSQQIAARTPSLAKPIGQALAESQGAPPSMGTAPGSLTPTSSDRGPSNMSQGVGHGVTATTTGSGLSSRPARSHISQGQAHRPSKKASSLQLKEGRSFTPLDDELCIQLNRILARNDITQDRTSSSNSWDDTHGPFYPHFAPSKRASLDDLKSQYMAMKAGVDVKSTIEKFAALPNVVQAVQKGVGAIPKAIPIAKGVMPGRVPMANAAAQAMRPVMQPHPEIGNLAQRLGADPAAMQKRLSGVNIIENAGNMSGKLTAGNMDPRQAAQLIKDRGSHMGNFTDTQGNSMMRAGQHFTHNGQDVVMAARGAGNGAIGHELWHSLHRDAVGSGDFSHMPWWSKQIAQRSSKGGLGDEFLARWYGNGDRMGAMKYLFNPGQGVNAGYAQQFARRGLPGSADTWQKFQGAYNTAGDIAKGTMGGGLAATAIGAPMALAYAAGGNKRKEKDNNSFSYIDDKNREEDRGYVSPTYEKSSHYPGCHGAKGGSGDTDARLNYHGGKGNGFSAVSFSGGRGRGKGKKGGKGSVGGSVVSSQASVPGGVQVARAKRAEASGGLDYSKGELPWVSGGGSVSHYSSTYSRAPHSMPPLHVEPSTLVSHIKKLAQANYMTPGTGGHGGSLGDPNYLIGATGGKGSSFSQSSSRTPSHNRLLAILKNITHTGGGKGPAGTVNGTYATTM